MKRNVWSRVIPPLERLAAEKGLKVPQALGVATGTPDARHEQRLAVLAAFLEECMPVPKKVVKPAMPFVKDAAIETKPNEKKDEKKVR